MVRNQGPAAQLRTRRIPFSRRVLIAPRRGGERRWEESFDLSLGGLFVSTMLPLEVGEVVDIDMPLDSLRFQAPAKVVWVRGSDESEDAPVGMALQFVNLNPNQKKLIHRAISNHTRGGGQLKVGSPPTNDQKLDTSASSARRVSGSRSLPVGEPGLKSSGRWWLIAAVVVVVAAVLFALLR